MKTLKALALVATNTDTNILIKTASSFSGLQLSTDTDTEKSIEQMGLGNYDLLIIDKNLSTEDYNKLNKVSDLLFPDAAVTNMPVQDEEFIRFKLSGLLSKWSDAQQDTTRKYFDNPSF